jgi:hypothetical protein
MVNQHIVVVIDVITPFLKAELGGGILLEPGLHFTVSIQVKTSHGIV